MKKILSKEYNISGIFCALEEEEGLHLTKYMTPKKIISGYKLIKLIHKQEEAIKILQKSTDQLHFLLENKNES